MRPLFRSALVCAVLVSRVAVAQTNAGSGAPEASLLGITRQWSRASTLGDLRDARTGGDHLELRVWGGYTLGGWTQGVVLRRVGGQWSAFLSRVMRCELLIPKSVGDTASRSTMQGYVVQARRQCGASLQDVGAGAHIITADSVLVQRLSVPDSVIEEAWTAADREGVSRLPEHVDRDWAMVDAFAYVIELRRGGNYRASVIQHVDGPETEADRRVRAIYAAVNDVLPPELRLKP